MDVVLRTGESLNSGVVSGSGLLAYTTFRNAIPPLLAEAGVELTRDHFCGRSGANFIGGAEILVTVTGWPFRNSSIPSLIFGEERNSGALWTAPLMMMCVLLGKP